MKATLIPMAEGTYHLSVDLGTNLVLAEVFVHLDERSMSVRVPYGIRVRGQDYRVACLLWTPKSGETSGGKAAACRLFGVAGPRPGGAPKSVNLLVERILKTVCAVFGWSLDYIPKLRDIK